MPKGKVGAGAAKRVKAKKKKGPSNYLGTGMADKAAKSLKSMYKRRKKRLSEI